MLWRPAPSPFRFILILLPLLTIAVAAWLWTMLADSAGRESYGPFTFLYGLALCLTLMLTGLLGYIAWCANSISYRLSVGSLTLGYGATRHVVPLSSITAVYAPGEKMGHDEDHKGTAIQVRWHGLADSIPGYLAGSGHSPQLGRVVSIATLPTGGQVFVVTHAVTFGLSPRRSLAFIDELKARVKIARDPALANGGEHPPRAPHTTTGRWLAWGAGLWGDRLVRWLLLSGLLLCVLFFGWLSLIYHDLPIILPLHWSAQAQIDRVGDLQELLRLPAIALGIWFVNALLAGLVRRRERAATIFLLASAIAVPVVFAAGALSIILRSI
ncbi:MAG: hypothetical protein WCD37_10490 [Chloroflexia bacterium]